MCTGQTVTVWQVAEGLARELGSDLQPEIVAKFRQGDIRHCVGDPARAREQLGFEASVAFAQGIGELVEWVRGQTASDRVAVAVQELTRRGLAGGSASHEG